MTPLSNRQRDAFANPAKAACREGNLRVLRAAACLARRRADKINQEQRMRTVCDLATQAA